MLKSQSENKDSATGSILTHDSEADRWIDTAEAVAPYVAEFAGTFFLVLTVGCSTLTGNPLWTPTSIAFAVMAGMYATSAVSGGHLNPAMSLAFGLSGKLEWRRVWGYCIAQVSAGLLAAGITTGLLGKELSVGPKAGYSLLDAFIVEVVYSTAFSFVALNCMASSRNNPKSDRNQFFALAVGFVAAAGGNTAVDVSGAFFNPAATLGFGLFSSSDRVWCLMYAGVQAAGSLAAVILFFLVRPEELGFLAAMSEEWSCVRACSALSCCGARHPRHREGEAHSSTGVSQAEDTYVPPVPARLLSEFLGTYVVVFTFGLSTVANAQRHTDATSGTTSSATTTVGPIPGEVHPESSTISWATGAAMLSMVYALATVSGAHFNPATTLAVVFSGRGKCSIPEALMVMLMQGAAAVAAAVTYLCVRRSGDFFNPYRVVDLGPRNDYSWRSVAIGEATFTMAVAFVSLSMLTVRSPRYSKAPTPKSFQSALAVGVCVTAGSYALEGISGGHLNPAVSLAVSAANFISSGFTLGARLSSLVEYVVFQSVGGVLAALVFILTHPLEYKEDPLLIRPLERPETHA